MGRSGTKPIRISKKLKSYRKYQKQMKYKLQRINDSFLLLDRDFDHNTDTSLLVSPQVNMFNTLLVENIL